MKFRTMTIEEARNFLFGYLYARDVKFSKEVDQYLIDNLGTSSLFIEINAGAFDSLICQTLNII